MFGLRWNVGVTSVSFRIVDGCMLLRLMLLRARAAQASATQAGAT